jgi:hypothetical protein
MANRDLLKEAIADAKSVKEAAIANAKAALEEAFTPYLKEKFTAKLAEMEKEDMDEAKHEEMDENYGEEKMEEKMSNPVMRHGMKGDDKEEKRTEKMKYGKDLGEAEDMDEEMDLDELLAELDEEMGKDKDMEENLNEDARTDAEEEGYEDGMEDEKEDEEEDEIDLEDMTEDELKDLIEDVIEDMVRAGELEAGENFESDEDEEEDIDIDMESEEEITERKKEGYDDREDESVSARRGKEADKKQSFKARRDDSYGKFGKRDAEAAGKASGPGKNKINKENLNEEEDMMDEGLLDKIKDIYNDKELLAKLITVDGKKMSIKDLLQLAASGATGGMKQSGAGKGPFNTEGVEEDKRTDAEEEGYLDGMRDEKEDMMREIEELASTLAETKLLNAKLLYSNKIFRAKNLNETQKVKVLEAFDKASSVKEAKLIYETLTTVRETKAAVNESVRGMASKAAGMAPEKKPILEVNDQFARWKVLAGIKNN